MRILSCLPEGVGMGLSCVVHLADSELTQGGFWETVLKAAGPWLSALWELEEAEAFWKSPGATRKSPVAKESSGN